MSAFSRGCISSLRAFNGSQQAQLLLHRNLLPPPPRTFSTSTLLRAKKSSSTKGAQKSVLNTLKKSPSSTSTSLTSPTRASYDSYASSLAKKGHSTLIYTAPSHAGYRFATNFLSASFVGAAVLSANVALRPSEGLPIWIPYIYGGAFIVCMVFSWNFLQRSSKLVQSLTAIPTSTARKGNSSVQIEILLRRSAIPFLKPKKILVAPEQIVIPAPFVRPTAKRVTEADLIAAAKLEREAKAKRLEDWKYDRDHILTSPFRHAKRVLGGAASEGWQGMKRSFNGEGFMEMRVQGKLLKLDTRGGWALDGGRAVDRLVKLEPHVSQWTGK